KADEKDLATIHQEGLRDFASPPPAPPPNVPPGVILVPAKGVAPTKKKNWEIKALDLVGVVMHEQPVVYVSEKLPDMNKLKETPTRQLDYFELAGLEKLHKGEELFVRGKEDTIRMLGAVRAAGKCLKCHDVPDGTLLGAFSYTLRPAVY